MKNNGKGLVWLFSLAYMVSYLTRINYSAVISAMEISTGFSKQALSLALTGSFITYGAGQIFSGVLGDKISPKKLVFGGLSVSVAMNILLPFCAFPQLMTAIWSINGLAQAFMWPPIVKLMVALLDGDEYKKGVVRVSWGSSIGTIIMYLSAPVIISFLNWKRVFFFSAGCGIITMILWWNLCPDIENIKTNPKYRSNETDAKIFTPVFCVLSASIVICGMIRDGVATWTPSLISESFNLTNESGILSGALLPVFSMICYEIALRLYNKKFNNPVFCAGIMFTMGILSSAVLSIFINKSPAFSVFSTALLNGSMHGVALMFTAMIPVFYVNTGKVSAISGLLNSFTYIGSAISTYGVAVLTEIFGWGVTVAVWIGVTVLGAAICFLTASPWKNQFNDKTL